MELTARPNLRSDGVIRLSRDGAWFPQWSFVDYTLRYSYVIPSSADFTRIVGHWVRPSPQLRWIQSLNAKRMIVFKCTSQPEIWDLLTMSVLMYLGNLTQYSER